MNRFIPREKMSKNERRKLDRAQRQTWVPPYISLVSCRFRISAKATMRVLSSSPCKCEWIAQRM